MKQFFSFCYSLSVFMELKKILLIDSFYFSCILTSLQKTAWMRTKTGRAQKKLKKSYIGNMQQRDYFPVLRLVLFWVSPTFEENLYNDI